jgi:RNA-binding protein YlmH
VLATTRTTAASRRADAQLTALFKVSRGEAQIAIEYGFVYRNFRPLTKRTQSLSIGDQIVYRTKGRAEIVGLETNPRSGRVWVEFLSFPA